MACFIRRLFKITQVSIITQTYTITKFDLLLRIQYTSMWSRWKSEFHWMVRVCVRMYHLSVISCVPTLKSKQFPFISTLHSKNIHQIMIIIVLYIRSHALHRTALNMTSLSLYWATKMFNLIWRRRNANESKSISSFLIEIIAQCFGRDDDDDDDGNIDWLLSALFDEKIMRKHTKKMRKKM